MNLEFDLDYARYRFNANLFIFGYQSENVTKCKMVHEVIYIHYIYIHIDGKVTHIVVKNDAILQHLSLYIQLRHFLRKGCSFTIISKLHNIPISILQYKTSVYENKS